MKNIITLSIVLFSSVLSYAGNPPAAVLKAFHERFHDASNVKWGKESSTEWEAEFSLKSIKVSANFKNDGAWVETETEIAITDLPLIVGDAIHKQYPGWTIVDAFRIESATKGTLYEADIKTGKKKKEVIYKEDGTVVK